MEGPYVDNNVMRRFQTDVSLVKDEMSSEKDNLQYHLLFFKGQYIFITFKM